jgi:hypothetical protein
LVPVQDVPSVTAGFEQAPVLGLQVPAEWHWSEAVQVTGLLPMHAPLWQVSACVQAFPSLQAVPLIAVGLEQVPVLGLQVPATWHWSLAAQVTGFVPTQAPAWQVSTCVHRLPSLHAVPFAEAGFEHIPLVGSQTPATWHWSAAEQTIRFDPVQVPAWHESVCVHAFPSLQVVPSVAVGFEQTPVEELQVPATWHWSEAVQVTGFEPVQTPLSQASVWVQEFPSLQVVPFAAVGFEQAPVMGSQVPAVWHWSLAEQTTGLLPVQTPAWHV